MKDEINKVNEKLDKLVDTNTRQDVVLAELSVIQQQQHLTQKEQHETLKEHTRRSTANEARITKMENFHMFTVKSVVALGSVVGIVAAIIRIVDSIT